MKTDFMEKNGIRYCDKVHVSLSSPDGREIYKMLCALLPPFYGSMIQKKMDEDQGFVEIEGVRYIINQEHHMWLLVQYMCELVGSHFYEIAHAAAMTAKCLTDKKSIEKNDEKFTYKTLYSMSAEDYDKIAKEMHEIANRD